MANKIHELKQNSMTFQARGLITGTRGQRFYRSGTSKSGKNWNEINFGVTIAPMQTIYVKLTGFEQNEVIYFERVKKGEKSNTVRVPWKNRKQSPGEKFRLNGVNISVGKDKDNKNINEVMVPYDVVEHLHETLKDGDSYYVGGTIQPRSYTDSQGNPKRSVDLIVGQMYYTDEPIDFNAEGFEAKHDIIVDPFVFSSIDKEMDENDKATGRFILSGYNIEYNNIEIMNFIIEAQDSILANKIKKKMKPGYAMKMFGTINVVHNIVEVDTDDEDDWGVTRKSSANRAVGGSSKFEYVLFDVKGETFDKETYSEDGIAAAMRAIRQSKEAAEKFVDTSDNDVNDGWGSDDDDDDDTPWD